MKYAIDALQYKKAITECDLKASEDILVDPESTEDDLDGLPEHIAELKEKLADFESALAVLQSVQTRIIIDI